MAVAPSQSTADYSGYTFITGIDQLLTQATALAEKLAADGQYNRARLLAAATRAYMDELHQIAQRTAQEARELIREELRKSLQRPDTQGNGGPRLGDYVGESYPLDVPGTVGLNYEPVLDANVPWWWTVEGPAEGGDYYGHVGREVVGFFFDADYGGPYKPDPNESRQHPLFIPGSQQSEAFGALGFSGGGAGPRGGRGRRMRIQHPIERHEFVRKGIEKAEARWHQRVRAAEARFVREVQRLSAGQAAVGAARRP